MRMRAMFSEKNLFWILKPQEILQQVSLAPLGQDFLCTMAKYLSTEIVVVVSEVMHKTRCDANG
jgi:hypothetical protein